MSQPPTQVRSQEIRHWLVERVAFYLERPGDEIATADNLIAMGLDSVSAFGLCGDVEDRFGVEAEPTMAWNHPTVDEITAHVMGLLGREASHGEGV